MSEGFDHVVHVAFREAEAVLEGRSSADQLGRLAVMFVTGFEFGVRLGQDRPGSCAPAVEWINTQVDDGEPLEVRERAFESDFERMLGPRRQIAEGLPLAEVDEPSWAEVAVQLGLTTPAAPRVTALYVCGFCRARTGRDFEAYHSRIHDTPDRSCAKADREQGPCQCSWRTG